MWVLLLQLVAGAGRREQDREGLLQTPVVRHRRELEEPRV